MYFVFLNWFDVLYNMSDTSCSSIQCKTIVKNLHLSAAVESDLKNYQSKINVLLTLRPEPLFCRHRDFYIAQSTA